MPGVERIVTEYDIKDFAAKNPGTPATSDIVIEYVLADNDFTCNVSVDGTPAVAVKFAYSGDMENQIGDEVSLKPWPMVHGLSTLSRYIYMYCGMI